MADTNFTTGPSSLPAVGKLTYNGCEFSPLFETKLSGVAVKDIARRTVKYIEYTLTVDGYVTLFDGEDTVDGVMSELYRLLTAQGGSLVYQGRGCDLIVNPVGNAVGSMDVAWGPIPEVLEFQPLGAGRSAKIRWEVKMCLPEEQVVAGRAAAGGPAMIVGAVQIPLLQFNYDTSVSYAEDGYSTLHVSGTLEIAMTRNPSQKTRTVPMTADDLRPAVEARIMSGIDLARFRVSSREFKTSRDKRTLEWNFTAEEKPYMDLPPDCTIARGSYSVRPAQSGTGLCKWLCTLRATYTVRHDRPRRTAWLAFLAMLRWRMAQSDLVPVLDIKAKPNQPRGVRVARKLFAPVRALKKAANLDFWDHLLETQKKQVEDGRNAWIVDFSFDEGLYLDSKTVTFSATWMLITTISHLLTGSGLWTKLPEENARGENLWALSMKDVSGADSWLPNRLNSKLDVIVDIGGG